MQASNFEIRDMCMWELTLNPLIHQTLTNIVAPLYGTLRE